MANRYGKQWLKYGVNKRLGSGKLFLILLNPKYFSVKCVNLKGHVVCLHLNKIKLVYVRFLKSGIAKLSTKCPLWMFRKPTISTQNYIKYNQEQHQACLICV